PASATPRPSRRRGRSTASWVSSFPEPIMPTIPLRGEHITVAQAVKAAGLAGSGGQAKSLVRGGVGSGNRSVETQPGRKLRAGDRFRVGDGDEWTVEEAG